MSAPSSPRPRYEWIALSLLMRLFVGGFFIYAATLKIIDSPDEFSKAIRSYEIINPLWANSIAIVLPWIEMLSGILLILGLWLREARWLIVAMLVVFLAATLLAIVRGLKIECGCTGENSDPSGWGVVRRNTAFLICLAIDAWALRRATVPKPAS